MLSRALPILLSLLLLTLAAPASVGEGEMTRLVSSRAEGPGWASFIATLAGPGFLNISTKYETAPGTHLSTGREAPSASAIWVEWLRADGAWQLAGGLQSFDCAREANRALLRIEGSVPDGLSFGVPAGEHPWQGGIHSGFGVNWNRASTFRITAFAAGEPEGDFWLTSDGTAGVSASSLRTGSHVGYLASDSRPTLGTYAQANQFSASARSGGRIDFPVENRLYTAIAVSNVPDHQSWADYRGPAPGWDQLRGNGPFAVNTMQGHYSIESLATVGIGWSNVIAGTFDGASAQCPATWLLADVDPPQAP